MSDVIVKRRPRYLVTNNHQRVLVTGDTYEGFAYVQVEIQRTDTCSGRSQFLNVRLDAIDQLIEMLTAERDDLKGAGAGGGDA